jgi:Skp family chaperone for outer membrane proteins
MKKVAWISGVAVLALLAGFGGSWIRDWAQPQQVEAQPQRAERGIRIALVNLEEVARRSPMFADRKLRWDRHQKALEDERKRIDDDINVKEAELRRARADNRSEDELLQLRVELEVLKRHRERAVEDHQFHMSLLLSKYQKEVLQYVRPEIERYAQLQKYDIVLQDYSVEDAEGLFSGDAYAQTLINKPVLYAPGVIDNSNPYVTDITEAIINRMAALAGND